MQRNRAERVIMTCRKALWLQARKALWSNCNRTQANRGFSCGGICCAAINASQLSCHPRLQDEAFNLFTTALDEREKAQIDYDEKSMNSFSAVGVNVSEVLQQIREMQVKHCVPRVGFLSAQFRSQKEETECHIWRSMHRVSSLRPCKRERQ